MQSKEYRKVSPNEFIRAKNLQEVIFLPKNYHLVKVLIQDKHGAPFKVARNLCPSPKPPILQIFETGFIENLPWDLRD